MIRRAERSDVARLVALQRASLEPPFVALGKGAILELIDAVPAGQLVAVSAGGELAGSVHSQRLASSDVLDGASIAEAPSLRDDGGPVWSRPPGGDPGAGACIQI